MTPTQARLLAERRERLARMSKPLPRSQPPRLENVPVASTNTVNFDLERRIREAAQIAAGMSVKWRSQRPPLMVRHIISMTAEFYGVSVEDLLSPSRCPSIASPRHVAMYLAVKLSERALEDLARTFFKRDHSTMIYATRKVAKLCARHEAMRDDLQVLTMRILERFDAMPKRQDVVFQPRFLFERRRASQPFSTPWTLVREAALADLWESGTKLEAIVQLLGVSRGSVCSKVRRLNLGRRRK